MEVSGSEGKKVLWKIVDDRVLEGPKDNDEIGIWGFYFNLFDADGRGGREENN